MKNIDNLQTVNSCFQTQGEEIKNCIGYCDRFNITNISKLTSDRFV